MEPFIGMIVQFGGNFAPRGWALCDGQLLPITSHSSLFSILGTTYGGDGRSTFGLPDLRGRVAMHAGTGAGLSPRSLGTKSGHEHVTLTTEQMPNHNHRVLAVNGVANTDDPTGNSFAHGAVYNNKSPTQQLKDTTISHTGGGQAFDVVQPFQVVNFIIALTGSYPSRN